METMQMVKVEKLVPELRFKGFEDNWHKLHFGDLYSFHTTNSLSRDKLNYDNGTIYNIHYGDIHTKFQSHFYLKNENVPLINSDENLSKIKEESFCKEGDIIIADASEDYADIGKSIELVNINNEKLVAGLHTFLARPISKNTAIGFMSYLLKSWKLRKQIMTIAQGTKVLSLSTGRVGQLRLKIPSLPEQQKIASFLSAVDEKIQQLTHKKELLEQYKKGVMQQLFCGKLRFKPSPVEALEIGDEYPDWEEKRLGEVAEVKRGAASQHLNYVSDETKGIRLLRINDFLSNDAVYVENTVDMKRFTVQTNDILIAGTGATAGIIFIVPEKFNNLSFSYNAPRIRVKNAYHSFIYHYLKSGVILKQQQRLFVGNAQPFLDTDAMRGFKIKLPSFPEQQKIANFLSSIDSKIESTNQQITQTQTFKKGLLQKMFV